MFILLCWGLFPLCCGMFLLCCALFVMLGHVSIVLWRYHYVAACFHCVVLISLCCGDFIVLWRFYCVVHYWATVTPPLRPHESQWEPTVGKHLSGFKIFKIVSKRCFVYISHICVYLVYHCFGFSFWMTNIQYTIDSCWYRQLIPLTQAQNVLVCSRL